MWQWTGAVAAVAEDSADEVEQAEAAAAAKMWGAAGRDRGTASDI